MTDIYECVQLGADPNKKAGSMWIYKETVGPWLRYECHSRSGYKCYYIIVCPSE